MAISAIATRKVRWRTSRCLATLPNLTAMTNGGLWLQIVRLGQFLMRFCVSLAICQRAPTLIPLRAATPSLGQVVPCRSVLGIAQEIRHVAALRGMPAELLR